MLPHPDECRQDIARFASPKRRIEWTATRVLLATLAGPEARIAHLPSGRPFLQENPAMSVSLSHTTGYAALILGRFGQTVGIDIEQYATRIDRLTHMFMNRQEKALPYEGKATWSNLLHWSAKETMFKCMDVAEVEFKKHLLVTPFWPQSCGVLHTHECKTDRQQTFDIRYLLRRDFVLTWTSVTVETQQTHQTLSHLVSPTVPAAR